MNIESIQDPHDVVGMIETIYGEPGMVAGLLHPTAVWRPPTGPLITLDINSNTPKSEIDFFVLNLVRARVDAIVTTGKILRSEPNLRLELQGPGSVPQALESWRREFLGKDQPPIGLVLTSGKELDLNHPFFASGRRIIFTSNDVASDKTGIVQEAEQRGIEVIGAMQPSLFEAIRFLREEMHLKTISTETGPSTSRALYEERCEVDELLLSTYFSESLPESVQGGAFLEPSQIQAHFRRRSSFRERKPDGEWVFERWLRRR